MRVREPLKLYDYQQKLHREVLAKFKAGEKEVCLAVAPSGGKTQVSIAVICSYLRANKKARALVLTHGTTVLRSNYTDRVSRYELGIRHDLYVPKSDGGHVPYEELKGRLVVSLPQSIFRIEKLGKFDLVVVDEAHERYGKDESNSIIDRVKAKHVLLLTGTPAKFIEEKVPLVAMSSASLFDIGRLADPIIEIARSAYKLSYKRDYNADGDVKETVRTKAKDTNATLKTVVRGLVRRLGADGIRSLGKTLVACRSIEQARQVHKYFGSIGVRSLLSHSDRFREGFDAESRNFSLFKSDSKVQVLVVVQRGILGFDMPELMNVVDMTNSLNPNRIFQLLSRGVRKFDGGRKLFIKLAPQSENLLAYTTAIMSIVMQLAASDEFFKTWDGKLQPRLDVFVPPEFREGGGGGGKESPKSKSINEEILIFDGWNKSVRNHSEYNGLVWTTFGEARQKLFGIRITDSVKNKSDILKMALCGESRPTIGKHRLGIVFHEYTTAGRGSYDPEFNEKIIKVAPEWFIDTVAENKNILLEMAKRKEEIPKTRTKIGNALGKYTRSRSESFDSIFNKQIRELAPHWFIKTVDKNKSTLLEMAKRKEKRPSLKTKLGVCLCSYVGNNSNNFDPIFKEKIRELAPLWFRDTKNSALLEMAKRKEKRPNFKTELGTYLCNRVVRDLVFRKKIRKLAPHWFRK